MATKETVKSKSKQPIILIVLSLAAVVLAVNLYKQKAEVPPTENQNQPSGMQLLPESLTEDERILLSPPPAEASQGAKDLHKATVAKLAKSAPYLEIKDCKPNPLVLEIKQGADLEIRNNDSVKRKLIFDEENSTEIEPNNKTTIKVEFKYGSGDYGFVCEGVGLTGFLHITP
jgi:hypothetical protein